MIARIDREVGIRHHVQFQGSNNRKTFLEFFKGLNENMDGEEAIVVIDNLSIHKAKEVLEYIERT